ncbi:MAG TPA: hypothetical protein VHE80_04605 [Acidimicrobiales bacterium]|nr:hypothetical protein [Acidimicrobiales bacterium]
MAMRHPRGIDLGAWFDGEGAGSVGEHVVRCARCQRRVSELARVRAWVRAQPFFAMGDHATAASPRRRWRPAMVPIMAVLLVLLLAPNRPWEGPRPMTAAGRANDQPAERAGRPSAGDAPPAGDTSPSTVVTQEPAPLLGVQPGATGDKAATGSSRSLRLGLIVPTIGSLAGEGVQITEVVRRRIELANASGGVGGRAVELLVVAAEDKAAVAALPRRVNALVGGFGAAPPPGVPWLLPADPAITGPDVLPAEPSPWAVGVELGRLLREQGLRGPIGVVVGPGPEAALADGLSIEAPTTRVAAASESSCASEVDSLRRAGAAALAVAGSPALAARCLESAARAQWAPPSGTLLAPSAAYGGLPRAAELEALRTVLALPWPTSSDPGAARFRATTRSQSYRALVSFAAAELAIDVARQRGNISLPAVASGTWRSDLLDLVGVTGRVGSVVVAGSGSWIRVPPISLPEIPALPLGAPAGLLGR